MGLAASSISPKEATWVLARISSSIWTRRDLVLTVLRVEMAVSVKRVEDTASERARETKDKVVSAQALELTQWMTLIADPSTSPLATFWLAQPDPQ